MAKDKELKKKIELSEVDLERIELLQRSSEKIGRQLAINTEQGNLEEIDELRELIGKEFENPEEKYNIYYRGIRKLLMDFLPKGKEFKEVRDIIYDEKNIFLNFGKRKSDNNGLLLDPRVSTARDNCESAITGTFNSLANAFKFREMVEISCSLFPPPFPFPPAVISCK